MMILIVLTLLNLNVTTKLLYHAPLLREREFLKTYICNKEVIH